MTNKEIKFAATQMEEIISDLDVRMDKVLKDSLVAYGEQEQTNFIEFDWENGDAPCVTYSGYEDIALCYINRVMFDREGNILSISLHEHYTGDDICSARIADMECGWKRELLNAVVCLLN